jgi:hypothetical protein
MTIGNVLAFNSLDPVTEEIIGTFPIYSQDDVNRVVTSAHEAASDWRALGYSGRQKVLLAWSKLLTNRIGECASLISRETGKPQRRNIRGQPGNRSPGMGRAKCPRGLADANSQTWDIDAEYVGNGGEISRWRSWRDRPVELSNFHSNGINCLRTSCGKYGRVQT